MVERALRDGDVLVTEEGFIFYAIGYCHPRGRVTAFLKYVPVEHARLFRLEWLGYKWTYRGRQYVRPKTLFSPEVYSEIVRTFAEHFPDYLHYDRGLGKWIVSVPLEKIAKVYTPESALRRLLAESRRDSLEDKAVRLVRLLSRESGVSLEFFGIHGSICLGMHNEYSDIDVTVYGAENYRRVVEAIRRLELRGLVSILRRGSAETLRGNTGVFEGTRFVVNAVRLYSEIECSDEEARAVAPAVLECVVVDDREGVFRPAVYKVAECEVLAGPAETSGVIEVVSMIGLYRGVARRGDLIVARGMLEDVISGERRYLRLVVGSGLGREYLAVVPRG